MNQRPIDASATPASTMMMWSEGGGVGVACSGLGAVLVRVGSQPDSVITSSQKPRSARLTVNYALLALTQPRSTRRRLQTEEHPTVHPPVPAPLGMQPACTLAPLWAARCKIGTNQPRRTFAAAAESAMPDKPDDRSRSPDSAQDSETPPRLEPDTETHEEAETRTDFDEGSETATSETSASPPNPADTRRIGMGAAVAVVGAAVTFLVVATDVHWSFSVPLGLLGCLVAAGGVFHAIGAFADSDEAEVVHVDAGILRARLVELAAALVVHVVSLRLSVAGTLLVGSVTSPDERPFSAIAGAAVLVTGSFLWLLIASFRVAEALGVWGANGVARPSLLRRHGFWLVTLTTLLYLPLLGSYSLSDPWETHYGEVAREMLARDDWISLWWAQDGWFWSKPVLTFWVEGLCFSLLGVRYQPDQMLAYVAEGRFPQPEWALRMPVFVFTLLGVYLLYKGVARAAGRRAALLGSIVLVCTPYWYFLAHQSMTDMLYVGPLTAAMGLILLGVYSDPERRVRAYEIAVGRRSFRLSAFHLLFGILMVCVLPQVLYLASRNLALHLAEPPYGFRPHLDEFFSGSGGGNCGLPGNQACHDELPLYRFFQPALGALVWTLGLGWLLWVNRGERRAQRLYYIAAWFFVVLAAMGKGAPGLVLGLLVPIVFIGATGKWKELTRLELGSAALIFVCLLLPWYVQMYVRHGQPFTDRLLFHDMYKRAFVHVHDTNKGVDTSFAYYVWQLGYGLFPWTGLCAGGMVWWVRWQRKDQRHDAAVLLVLWFVLAFCMFAISMTKFHHYVFPAVPPAAMLAGLMLDEVWERIELRRLSRSIPVFGAGGVGLLVSLYGVSRLFPGSWTGTVLSGQPMQPPSLLAGAVCITLGLALTIASGWLLLRGGNDEGEPAKTLRSPVEDRDGDPPDEPAKYASASPVPDASSPSGESRETASVLFGAIGIASAVLIGLMGRDLLTSHPGNVAGPARLVQLFSYNYDRLWPETLNFDAVLGAFTCVAALLSLLFLLRRARPWLLSLFCCTAVLWMVWGVNVYLVQISPHWGQRETVAAYYLDRASPEEPLVAYQMNWKGENFYTGNRIPAFVSSGDKFKTWVQEQRKSGVKTIYFTTEHTRVKTLKRELGKPKDFALITTKELNNKFGIMRSR